MNDERKENEQRADLKRAQAREQSAEEKRTIMEGVFANLSPRVRREMRRVLKRQRGKESMTDMMARLGRRA